MIRNPGFVSVLASLIAAAFFLVPAFASAATLTVNNGVACNDAGPTYCTIQAAVTASGAGDTITVAAGTYDAFSVVGKTNLTISGAGVGNTFIKPTTLINTGVGHKYTADMLASVFVNTSTGVTLSGMDVEDNGQTPDSGGPDAMIFWNASTGNITGMKVQGTYAINGVQSGQGIAVDAGSAQTTNLTVTNTAISGFQKNGIDAVDGNSLTSNPGNITVTVTGGSITGAGSISTIAQNGILYWNQGGGTVTGTVNGTTISNLEYAPTPEATGILAYGTASIPTVSNVSFSNTDLYIESASSGTAINATTGNTFDGVSPSGATGTQLASIENKLYGIMEDTTVDPIFILPNTFIVTLTNLGIQAGLNVAATGDTVLVTPGTYSGDPTPPASDKVTLAGIGGPVITLGSGYGINLDNNVAVTNFTFSGFTVNSSSGTTYAFKAYKANGLTLTNDTFNGNTFGGGVDINTTSNVNFNNVTATGFHKNGFADTAAYTAADDAVSGNNVTFNGITSTNNGWTGISFYTVGGSGGSASIKGVKFLGTNTISGNGSEGIFIEGDSDANAAAFNTPANTVTTDGTTLDLDDVIAFSGNPAYDIVNYQTAPVTALTATFGGLTGTQMTSAQRTTEDGKIIDKLDHANLGLVTYWLATYTVTIDKFVDGAQATAGNTNSTSFPMQSSWTNIPASGSGTYDLGTDDSYQAVTAPMNAGATYTTNEVLGTTVGATCQTGDPYGLLGYSTGTTLAAAQAADSSATVPNFGNLQSNEYVIVWNQTCPVVSTLKVHVLKYLGGTQATAATANNYLFPMTATWTTANLNGGAQGTGNYNLGSSWGGASALYGADTAAMDAPAAYATNEITNDIDPTSKVLPIGATCVAGDYRLDGYQTSATSFADAVTQSVLPTSPAFTGLATDQYVIVDNETCPTTGSLTIQKNTIGGNGTFKFTSDIPGGSSFSIVTTGTTAGGTGTSQTFSNLTPGTYHITETAQTGWTMTDNECSAVTVAAGDPVVCIVTNTKNTKLGEIRGTKYEDLDGDGTLKDGDHHRIAGVTIYLDTNNNGHLDSGEPTSVTDAHGNYDFVGLAAGTYHVREVVPTGWTETVPSSGVYNVTLSAGQIVKKENFGDFKLGTISGMKFDDINGNGRKDKGDVGLPNVTINLKGPHGFSASTVTDANGNYSFSNLGPGVYTLSEVVPKGWNQTLHPSQVRILSGTNAKNENFGDTQRSKNRWGGYWGN